MWNESEYTYEERAEFFKTLVYQLEEENEELRKENEELRLKLSYHRNPEDAYREDFTIH